MVTNKSYTQNRRQNSVKILLKNLFLAFGTVLVLSAANTAFAQGSTIEKNNYKPKSTPKKAKPKPKKAAAKVVPKKTTQKKVTPTKVRSTPKRKRSRSRTKQSRPKNSILVTFFTSEPMLEVWNGEKSLGVTDENAKLETWMKQGNFLISVKSKTGEVVVESLLVSISKENKEIRLVAKAKVEEPKQPTAEELLMQQEKVSLAASERITDILKRYGDPQKINTISLEDWNFVYQNAQANKLKNFTAIQIEAQRWFSTGQIELAKGNYANAYTAFTEAVKFMPNSAYPYYALGEAYTANKETPKALTNYQKAVSIDSKFALAHRRIGSIYLETNQTKEAVPYFEAAIKNGFDTPDVRFDLAKSLLRNRRWEDAAEELEYVVEKSPTGDVYLTLGELYTELKRNISAYEAYKNATAVSPNSALAFYKLGEILLEEKEYERAKIAFERAVELDEKGKEINVSQAKKMIRESAQKLK